MKSNNRQSKYGVENSTIVQNIKFDANVRVNVFDNENITLSNLYLQIECK